MRFGRLVAHVAIGCLTMLVSEGFLSDDTLAGVESVNQARWHGRQYDCPSWAARLSSIRRAGVVALIYGSETKWLDRNM